MIFVEKSYVLWSMLSLLQLICDKKRKPQEWDFKILKNNRPKTKFKLSRQVVHKYT